MITRKTGCFAKDRFLADIVTSWTFANGRKFQDTKGEEQMTTVAQPAMSKQLAEGKLPQLRVEPRCRICRDPQVRQLVNDLLSHGYSFPSIVRVLEPVNATRQANRRITDACVRKHRKRHFDLQAPAAAVWRRVLEERAAESQGAYEDGVTNLVTAASYFEIMMRKGFSTMVAEDTVITPEQGGWAAKQLNEITKQDVDADRFAKQQVELNRIIAAFRELPPAYQQLLLDKLDGKAPTPIAVKAERSGEIEEFDPGDEEGFEEDGTCPQ